MSDDCRAAIRSGGILWTSGVRGRPAIMSSIEGRTSAIDQVRAAQFTAPGIAAHESALRGGIPVDIPSFEE